MGSRIAIASPATTRALDLALLHLLVPALVLSTCVVLLQKNTAAAARLICMRSRFGSSRACAAVVGGESCSGLRRSSAVDPAAAFLFIHTHRYSCRRMRESRVWGGRFRGPFVALSDPATYACAAARVTGPAATAASSSSVAADSSCAERASGRQR